MITIYKTVKRMGKAEMTVKKSRFIGHAKPVETEEEAIAFIESIKKEHWSATHNCSAYVIGERDQIQKASDDGEPSGTAGRPILEVIKQQGLKNTVVVVTRYFGGILLGAGGLIRAYTEGAVIGIQAAEPVYKVLHREVRIGLDYTWLGKVENELRNRNVMTGTPEFSDKVTLVCYPYEEEAERFVAWVTDLTQGRGDIVLGEALYVDHDENPFE